LDRRRASFDIAFALKKVTIPGFRKALSSRAASRKLGQARLKSALCGAGAVDLLYRAVVGERLAHVVPSPSRMARPSV